MSDPTTEWNLPSEKLFRTSEAVERATGQTISATTCWRWATAKRNPLQTWKLGGRRFSTVAAVLAFMQARSEQPASQDPKPRRSQTRRQKAIAKADSDLLKVLS